MHNAPSIRAAALAAIVTFVFGCGDDSGSNKEPSKNSTCAPDCPANDQDSGASGGEMSSNGANQDSSVPQAKAIVGKACEEETDCSGDLYCNYDDEDYIAHKQCTQSCAGDTCPKGSKCIGAMICVAECSTDTDCPEKSVCNKNGWCSRTGPGSGVPFCTGVALSCFSASDSTSCIGRLGCSGRGDCTGVAPSCYSQYSSSSCYAVSGCTWSSSSKTCTGVARSCSSMTGEYTCEAQMGCSWDYTCSGTAYTCEGLPLSVCAKQPGCTVNSGT